MVKKILVALIVLIVCCSALLWVDVCLEAKFIQNLTALVGVKEEDLEKEFGLQAWEKREGKFHDYFRLRYFYPLWRILRKDDCLIVFLQIKDDRVLGVVCAMYPRSWRQVYPQ